MGSSGNAEYMGLFILHRVGKGNSPNIREKQLILWL